MNNSIWYQSVLFTLFILLGAVSAFLYDTFRISDKFVRSGFLFTLLKDMVFWLVITIMMFGICLKFNNGEIRFFMFAGLFFGAVAYFNTISKCLMSFMFFLINIIKNIFVFLFKILLIPFKFVLKLVNKPVIIALSFSKNSILTISKKIQFKFKKFMKFKR